ncbi:O-antigen polymerase [Cytobacillus sp. FSL R5-0596]|uniref:O-antigen polymerase n=1 Tax=Cytobacillus sp. FSL R5-0596 TaxID=2954696 RepID=UPI0030F804AD
MGETSILLLSIIYFITAIFYIALEIHWVYKYKRIRTIAYVRFLYSLIYGFLPALVHSHVYLTGETVARISYSQTGIMQLYILYILSVVVYFFLSLGYRISSSTNVKNNKQKVGIASEKLFAASLIILLIGFLSFFMWTLAYGSLFGVMEYAKVLRSGVAVINNPFSFMKRTSTLMIFSSYMFFAVLLNLPKGIGPKKITVFILFSFSSFWSMIYLLSNDGRMSFIYFFLIFILYAVFNKQSKSENINIRNTSIKISIWLIIAFIAMALSDWIMYFFRNGESRTAEVSFNIFEMIREELGYTILSGQVSLTALVNGDAGDRILVDALSTLFAFLPSRFRPDGIVTLFSYNTELVGNTTGTVPTDLLSMCIYNLGIVGVCLIPIFLGWIIRKIENVITTNRGNVYYDMLYIIVSLYLARFLAYADPANYVHAILFIIIGHVTVIVISATKFSKL